MSREDQIVARRVQDSLARAEKAAEGYIRELHSTPIRDMDRDIELHDAETGLAHCIRTVFLQCAVLAERLHIPTEAQSIRDRLASLEKSGLTSVDFNPADAEAYCPALAEIWGRFGPLQDLALSGAVSGLSVLETILGNTAVIIADSGAKPSREIDVTKAVLRVVQYAFEGATENVPIAKVFKTYKPDIGVPSLMAAAEYKFLKAKKDMKSHIDQVLADMRGYGGDPDWQTFYAVFYQTEPFYTQKNVEHMFASVSADSNWKPIVLNGPSAT